MEPRVTFTSQELHRLSPPERHARLLAAFDGLDAGDAFAIVSDHDLAPIRRLLERERGAEVAWEDVEAGPATWRVRIRRCA